MMVQISGAPIRAEETVVAAEGMSMDEVHAGLKAGDEPMVLRCLVEDDHRQKERWGGLSWLHVAVEYDRWDVVQCLLSHGWSPNIIGSRKGLGETPLHRAAANGQDRMVNLLLQHGAGVNVTDGNGNTPLHRAACGNHASTVRHLCAQRAYTEGRNHDHATPWLEAAQAGSLEALRVLVSFGTCRHAVDRRGQTALHRAAQKGRLTVLPVLLAWGVPWEKEDGNGNTAWDVAYQSRQFHAADLLLSTAMKRQREVLRAEGEKAVGNLPEAAWRRL